MNKDFKNYTYEDCLNYCHYMKAKFEKAFTSFYDDKRTFKTMFKEIKNEIKEDYQKSKLKVNENIIVIQHLDLLGAYCEINEPVNSKNVDKMYSELLSSWYDLKWYLKAEDKKELFIN